MCLHEDTDITFITHYKGAVNCKKKTTLKELYKMWSGEIKYQGGEKGKMNVRKRWVRLYNEDTQRFEKSKTVDVIDSGIKEVFQITDSFGNTISASKDYDFLTVNGWKKLKDLIVGDFLIRDDVGESFGGNIPPERGLDKAIRNKMRTKAKNCVKCGSKDTLEVDHIIPVKDRPDLAKVESNLQILCKSCHKEKTSKERKPQTNLLPKAVEIVDIVNIGEAQTYNLSIERICNFLGNGFVVNNSWNEED